MTFLSLFTGIGGLDLGLERAGMRCVGQVEIDHFCRKVLEKHWPNVRRWDDIRTFEPDDSWKADLICGGFPCKQTSVAAAIQGRRSGLRGPDSGLWYEMLRVVRWLRPSRVIVENTPGVSAWKDEITRGLEDSGYWASELHVSAAGVGAPHLRRRVFFVADVDRARLAITWPERSRAIDSEPRGASDRNAWLSSVAGGLRVADGIPSGVDRRKRIECLGNAVVPQVAEWIGRRIVSVS